MTTSSVLAPASATVPGRPLPTGRRLRILVVGRLRILMVEVPRDGANDLRRLLERLDCDLAVAYPAPPNGRQRRAEEADPEYVLTKPADPASLLQTLAGAPSLARKCGRWSFAPAPCTCPDCIGQREYERELLGLPAYPARRRLSRRGRDL